MFGSPHLHLRSTGSTNDRARELAEAGAPSGTVVTADEQSAGRGRRGRAWSAPPGKALLFSAILRPLELEHVLLPLSVPVAVCEAVEALAPVEARIKWPNDVWIDEAKVVGGADRGPAAGLGGDRDRHQRLDRARPSSPATCAGRRRRSAHGATVGAARDAVTAALGRWVEAPAERVLAEFRRRDALRGREIGWEGAGVEPGSGIAAGVDDRGNLVVELADGGSVALGSGEVSLRVRR